MYSSVGTGLLKGEFAVTRLDGTIEIRTPREIFGLKRYSRLMGPGQPHQVRVADDLRRVTERFCGRLESGDRLSFRGWVSTQRGWQPLEGDDLCGTRQ